MTRARRKPRPLAIELLVCGPRECTHSTRPQRRDECSQCLEVDGALAKRRIKRATVLTAAVINLADYRGAGTLVDLAEAVAGWPPAIVEEDPE